MIALSKNKGRGTALVQGPQQNPHSPVDLKHQWLNAAVSTVMEYMNSMFTVNSNVLTKFHNESEKFPFTNVEALCAFA